jgi:multisubunit Na+/H+ antiporter MnhC subunit
MREAACFFTCISFFLLLQHPALMTELMNITMLKRAVSSAFKAIGRSNASGPKRK